MSHSNLIDQNVGLVYSIAGKFCRPSSMYFDDYISVGMEGLWVASDTFDESLGHKFSTYAYRCIRNAVSSCAKKNSKRPKHYTYIDNVSGYTQCDNWLVDLLSVLTKTEQDILSLRLEGYSFSEIGSQYGHKTVWAFKKFKSIQDKITRENSL